MNSSEENGEMRLLINLLLWGVILVIFCILSILIVPFAFVAGIRELLSEFKE